MSIEHEACHTHTHTNGILWWTPCGPIITTPRANHQRQMKCKEMWCQPKQLQIFFLFLCCCFAPYRFVCTRPKRPNSLLWTIAKVKLHFRLLDGEINFIFSLSSYTPPPLLSVSGVRLKTEKSGIWLAGWLVCWWKNMVKVRKVSHPMDLVDVMKSAGRRQRVEAWPKRGAFLFMCFHFFSRQHQWI